MRSTMRRGVAYALLALPLLSLVPAPAGAASLTAQRKAAIAGLMRSAQAHRTVTGYFTSRAVLQIGTKKVRGSKAIGQWWQAQFRAGLKLSLQSPLALHGAVGSAMVRRSTRTADCRSGCVQQARWQFTGARISSMVLELLPRVVPTGPPRTVPPPPTAAPKTTPTIPT